MRKESIYKPLGDFIKSQRERKGLTQADLAEKLGFSRENMTNMEAGRIRIPCHVLHLLSKTLDFKINAACNAIEYAGQQPTDSKVREGSNE